MARPKGLGGYHRKTHCPAKKGRTPWEKEEFGLWKAVNKGYKYFLKDPKRKHLIKHPYRVYKEALWEKEN